MSLLSTSTIKSQLLSALGQKAPLYWHVLQQYLSGSISRIEYDEQVKEYLDTTPLVQLHNSLIVSLFDTSAHLAPPTPPPDIPKPPPRKRRRTLPYQGSDSLDTTTLRSSRLKRWTVGMGRRERERVRTLESYASTLLPSPQPYKNEIAAERGVQLIEERGEPPGGRLPVPLATVNRSFSVQHIADRINLISAQHNLGTPSKAVSSLMMLAFEAKLKQLITQALSLTSTSHAITSIRAAVPHARSHVLSASSFDSLFTVSPAVLPNKSAAAMRLALGDNDGYDEDEYLSRSREDRTKFRKGPSRGSKDDRKVHRRSCAGRQVHQGVWDLRGGLRRQGRGCCLYRHPAHLPLRERAGRSECRQTRPLRESHNIKRGGAEGAAEARKGEKPVLHGSDVDALPAAHEGGQADCGGGHAGDPVVLHADLSADFGIEHLPLTHRMLDPKLGGGALLDLGPYPMFWTILALYEHPSNKNARPTSVSASMVKTPITGVDSNTSFTVNFTEHLRAQAILSCSMTVPTASFGATIRYKNGNIVIGTPIYRPTSFTVQYYDKPGSGVVVREEKLTFSYAGGGWFYEADEVARCVRDGKLESELWGHEKSIMVMEIFDEVRRQGGYKFPDGVEKVF
ncbi:hypothetical protein A0H81_06044 [Grifola frondosa]|uniref:GFO/IDH/MocA-like oxidoreductase domain-containing protein n=1 Tax=Grifola frondosa TaxID=5627 RepID=A0A1C7MAI1_GRIFR|nr:hypothetical protein A0H81_06044 [Grifola frondosa]